MRFVSFGLRYDLHLKADKQKNGKKNHENLPIFWSEMYKSEKVVIESLKQIM